MGSDAGDTEILPPDPIRVETALSRFPVHRLAKRGDIAIDIRETRESGEVSIKWEVTHSPGPLAYKIDTLIINRRIEEAPRPIPRVVRLGSLREITEELGSSTHNDKIRESLHRNAIVYIKANIKYRTPGGGERRLEAGFTRYSVVFTGEELPDGRKADAVYIILNDIYMQVINGAMTRPLDYNYLRALPPAPQRFYEILSYQVYAAIKNDRSRARLAYSEFCTYAPQTRYLGFDRVKKQMYKVHAVHRKSGYIAGVDYEATTDGEGRPDWLMFYTPGPKARAEYRAFTRRGGPVAPAVEPIPADPPPRPAVAGPSAAEAELIGRGVTAAVAAALVREHGAEAVRHQIEHLDWLAEKKPGRVADPAAWLVTAVRNGHAPPKGFVSRAERAAREGARRAKDRAEAEARRSRREEAARDRSERSEVEAYLGGLSGSERSALEAEALAGADPEARRAYEEAPPGRFRSAMLRGLVREHVARRLAGGAQASGTAKATMGREN